MVAVVKKDIRITLLKHNEQMRASPCSQIDQAYLITTGKAVEGLVTRRCNLELTATAGSQNVQALRLFERGKRCSIAVLKLFRYLKIFCTSTEERLCKKLVEGSGSLVLQYDLFANVSR